MAQRLSVLPFVRIHCFFGVVLVMSIRYLIKSKQINLMKLLTLDFPRFSRQLIMSGTTKRNLNERHQIYGRV
jgi:hypothetical protein